MPVGVAVLDAHEKLHYLNQRGKELFGKKVLQEASVSQLSEIYQLYRAGTKQIYPIRALLNGERTSTDDIEIYRQESPAISVEAWSTPIYNAQGQVQLSVIAFQDITSRKQAEADRIEFTKELKRQNAQLEKAQKELAETNQELEKTVAARTQQLSETVEQLRATQEQLVLENQILRKAEKPLTYYEYHINGTVPSDSPTYVVRAADRLLYYYLLNSEFCYILNARQMGKSSLRVKMTNQLKSQGYTCALVDISSLGTEEITSPRRRPTTAASSRTS